MCLNSANIPSTSSHLTKKDTFAPLLLMLHLSNVDIGRKICLRENTLLVIELVRKIREGYILIYLLDINITREYNTYII